jgi:hypothetical protein
MAGEKDKSDTEEASAGGGDDDDEEDEEEEKSEQRSTTNQGSNNKRNLESTQEESSSSTLQKRARQQQSLGKLPYSVAMLNASDSGLHNLQQPPAPFPSPYFNPYAMTGSTTHMHPPPQDPSASKKVPAIDSNYNNHKNPAAKDKTTQDSEKMEAATFMPQQPPMSYQQFYTPLMIFPPFGTSQGFGLPQPPPPPPAYFMTAAGGGGCGGSSSAAMMAGTMMAAHSGFMAPPPMMMMKFPSRGINLAMQCDAEQLSEYQILVRQQLELFEASVEDVESNTQGRKKPVGK